MPHYVVTFFGRNEKRQRFKLFDEGSYSWYDEDGQYHWWRGMHPDTIKQMLDYFDGHPLSGMLRGYNIPWALTDLSTSSIIIDLKADDPEMLDEMLVTLKMFAGPDIRICLPEELPVKRKTMGEKSIRPKGRDRYAR